MPLQRLDETEQRGERGAQFVARRRDEVRAHLLDAALPGQVANIDENALDRARIADRRDERPAMAFKRARSGEFDRARALAGGDRFGGLKDVRRAQGGGEMAPFERLGADEFLGRRIGVLNDPAGVENEQRLRERLRDAARKAQR